jgi:hypothetical protein
MIGLPPKMAGSEVMRVRSGLGIQALYHNPMAPSLRRAKRDPE